MKKRHVLALGALCAALGACGASEYKRISHDSSGDSTGGTTGGSVDIEGTGATGGTGTGGSAASGGTSASGGSTSGGSTSGGSTSGGTSGGAGDSGVVGGSSGTDTCSPGIPATSQVPRMKNAAYDNVIRDLLGVTTVTAANGPPSLLLAPDSDGDITAAEWQAYLSAAGQIASAVMAGDQKSNFITCDATDADCATNTIKTFGRKAFRRPLTDTEVTSFMRLTMADPPGTADEVAEAILYTFLASPSFIMLPELGSAQEGDAIRLTDYEVATRLSFLLWNSVPDGALSDAADNGALETKDEILAQAQRMLASPNAGAVVTAFGHAYLGIGSPTLSWFKTDHDTSVYPKYSAAAVAPLTAEIDRLFSDVVSRGQTFKDLFLTTDAYVNQDTAALYGLDPTQFGGDLALVQLDPTQRPGILTRAGFLSSFSHYSETAPVLRGSFVETNVIGIDPGPSPPNSGEMPVPPNDFQTMRAEVEAIVAPTQCSGCHQIIDPAGFVLEHYDAVGSWQDQDPKGGPIDGTADVMFSDTDTRTITSPLELMTAIAGSSGAQRHYAEKLVAYASGRDPNPMDACTVDTLAANLARRDYQLLELFADYTQADSFRLRTVGN
jgi:hypothetical protein